MTPDPTVTTATAVGADGPAAPLPDGGAPEALTVHRVDAAAMAARAVALIEDWIEHGRAPSDIAVLARVNSSLLPVQVALGEAGVPRSAPLEASILGRTGIRSALAWLRIGLDPERIKREDLQDTLRRPSRKLIGAMKPHLQRGGGRWSLGRLESLCDLLDGRHADRLQEYLADVEVLTGRITDGVDTAGALRIIRNRIGLGEAIDTLDSSRTRPEGSSHGDDLDALEQLAALHPSPVTFRQWLVEALRRPSDDDGVALSTVHRVKGMEWDDVIVFAASSGLFPHRLAEDIEEERRVFHVAITRCRQRAAVIGNRDAMSPFVAQLFSAAEDPTPSARGVHAPDPVEARRTADGEVLAVPGTEVTVPGGVTGRIVAVMDGEARIAVAGSEIGVPLGSRVDAGRWSGPLVAPRRRATPTLLGAEPARDEADMALYEALRTWRAETARAAEVPAYVVLHDSHLMEIAEKRPTTLPSLGRVKGVGPTKLERYGEDILEIVDGFL